MEEKQSVRIFASVLVLMILITVCAVLFIIIHSKSTSRSATNLKPVPTYTVKESDLAIFPHGSLSPTEDPVQMNQKLSSVTNGHVVYLPNNHNTQSDLPLFQKRAVAQAKPTDVIQITNCEFYPVSVKIPSSGRVQVINTDPFDHTIQMGHQSFVVGSKKTTAVQVVKSKDVSYYYCSTDPIHVGWLVF